MTAEKGHGSAQRGASAFGVMDVLKLKVENLAEKPAEAYVSSTCKSGFEHDASWLTASAFKALTVSRAINLVLRKYGIVAASAVLVTAVKTEHTATHPQQWRRDSSSHWASSKNEALAAPDWDI
ncbi:MAG: hypothetical protein ACKERG_04265 [Candidatus Hodgkinia cicadicola]